MNQAGKANKGIIITTAVLVVAMAMAGLGYWLATRNNGTAQQTPSGDTMVATDEEMTTEDAESYCTDDGWQVYRNVEIGLEFCYPVLWGATSLTPPQASESAAGSGYEIVFSAYDTVISSVTSDYQNTIGRGGRCADPTSQPPDFSRYTTEWDIQDVDSELSLVVRYPLVRDGVYLVTETASSFDSALCYGALVVMADGDYPVVNVALSRPLGEIRPADYAGNTELLFSDEERENFTKVIDSVRVAE